MAIRERLNHVAAGIAASFISRNNDLIGYWAPGLLYREAAAPARLVHVDLFGGLSQPATPACAQVARNYAHFMRRALIKQGLLLERVTQASMTVQFNVPSTNRRLENGLCGDPFEVTVMLAAGGREGHASRRSRCLPVQALQFEGQQFRRSARWPA